MEKLEKNFKKELCFVFPTVSGWSRLGKSLLRWCGLCVFYRGDFDKELVSDKPTDLFYESTGEFGKFLHFAITPGETKKIAEAFSLNPEFLLSMAREAMVKRFEHDFNYAFLVNRRRASQRLNFVFPVTASWRSELKKILNENSENPLAVIFSGLGLAFERIQLAFMVLVKAFYVLCLLIYWRFTKPSLIAEKICGNFLWLPGGPNEISFTADDLSLPLYLKEIQETADLQGKRFAVLCPFLKEGQLWDETHSFAVPNLRDIPPGLSHVSFLKRTGDLLKLIFRVPPALFRSNEELRALNLLPLLFLQKAWFNSVNVPAVFVTESSLGVASPLVHAARELNIPVIMIFYSANVSPVVLKKENQGVVPVEFQYMLADHFFVWTEDMKHWLQNIGYPSEKFFVVGPQMFAPVKKLENEEEETSDCVKVGLFDIPPVPLETLLQWGKGESIKNAAYWMTFRKKAYEVIKKVFGENFKIIIKMKREASEKRFDTRWNDELNAAAPDMASHLIIKKANANPWLVIDEADFVISMPFTSLGEAALAMGKPSVFFDPTGLILPRPGDQVPFLPNEIDLHRWLVYMKDNLKKYKAQSRPLGFGAPKVADTLNEISVSLNSLQNPELLHSLTSQRKT